MDSNGNNTKKKLWFCGLLWWSLLLELSSGASFFGDGFIHLKATESSDHNILHVRFRTSSTNGLMFLAAGQANYFLLELHAGRLQVRLDLGSGEQVLESERGVQLNDLAWHSVEVHHVQLNVTLTVDKNSHTSVKMPGSHHHLHIKDGLYVGGSGGLDKIYLPRNLIGFRGCLDEVVFNQHDLVSSLRPYTGYKNIYEVSLGCSPQFFATEEEPISFFSSRAYLSLPTWNHHHHQAAFECVLHTSANEGVILYSSARDGGFVALEIQEGFPVAVVGKNGVKTELHSQTSINDRKWHSLKLHFSSRNLELTVDKEMVKSSISSHSKRLHLKGFLYVGGIDDGTRLEVRKVGLASVSGRRARGGSFKGCLRNIEINRVKMGLSNAVVTKDISVGCEPEKLPEESTHVSPTITPRSVLYYVTPTSSLQMSTLAVGLDKRYGLDFVHFKNLVVQEGGRASLDAKHIKVFLDFKALGIRQSQIMFRIEEQPVRGQIRLDVDDEQEENTFGMLDLWHGRVMYVHGGSEEPDDFIMFSIYCSSRKLVPDYLKSSKLYRYNITVTPTNDAPELSLPEGNLFVILERSKKHLTTEVLKVTDIDSNYTDLVFSVLGNLNADAGYLELEGNPGKAETSFSYVDLDEMRVYYVHTGVRNSRIALRVSDGDKVSNTVVLRIMAIVLEYEIANNTGLELTQGETAIISSKQLAVQTNAMKQTVDIRYDIIEPPQFGELQRLHSSGEWRHTESFSQRLLEKERLRYVSTFQDIQTSNISDYFKCKVNVAARANTEIIFPIAVKWVRYHLARNVMINMDKVRKVTLSSECLVARADGVTLSDEELYFRVLTTPKKGKLLLDSTVLMKNSTFSQRDLSDERVHYELVDRPYEDTTDRFKFQLISKHAQSENYDFQFSIKADINTVFMKNEGLSLQEGESKLITKDELFAETLSTRDMFYTVISSPKHGRLARISQSNSNASYDNILTFSNQDIMQERLMYIHDDSETTQDDFAFIASTNQGFKSSISDNEVGSKEGTFNITVQLVNDEKPIRIIDKVFHVVRNGQKLLTTEDLLYHDNDSDFDDGQLIYTRRGIPMGDLVLVNDTTHRLFQFAQKDLEEKRVLFIHKGASIGRFVLFVSDGKNFVSSLLDVSAHDPFLKADNNTGLLVQKGQSVMFTTYNFSIVSNMDIRDDREVIIKLEEPPRYGSIYRNKTKVESFTQSDLKDGLISYSHDDSKHLADHFNLTVKAKVLQITERVNVKVYLESHQRPPIIQHLETLLVEEGKPVKIDETKLEVTHEDNLPSEIVFAVKVAPSHGFLRRFFEADERYIGTKQSPVKMFTQDDINKGNIQYVQVEPNKVNDTFVLDATNGITDVSNIRISVDIIPLLIPLHVTNFTINEGASKALTEDVLKVTNRHFSGLNFFYNLTKPPLHGHIEHSRHPGVPITTFTRRQVEHEFIYYAHDSSETLVDNFTVEANDTGLRKHSAAQTVYIELTAVNDESPVITTNRVLRVWVSSITEIRPEDLRAEDLDTPADELQFMVTPPSNGHLALKSNPMKAVLNFTQAHIEQGQLLFVHKGAMSGGFNFQVNDGVNFTPRQIFSITAKALVVNLEKNRPLKVFPGSSSPITNDDLQAVTNDIGSTSNRTIMFNVIRHPKLGRLVKRQLDNSTVEISTFTQDMVNRKEVIYIQTPIESVGWEAMDSITFSVSSPPASIDGQTFKIDISYENTGPEHNTVLLKNTGAEVAEGESVVIDEFKLDASNLMSKLSSPQRSSYEVWFQVTDLPQHGVIVVGERNLTKEKPNFSQFIVTKYGIIYSHDNSETTRDSFVFSAWLNPKGRTAQRPEDEKDVVIERFNITVRPVNDQPPVLKTKTPGLKVVQGDKVAIGPEDLRVEDLDDPPEDITFSVISKPSNGYIALQGGLNESVVSFTQAQINSRNVYFIHDGTSASGVFYFSVTDGHHKPVYKLFNIDVSEITVTLLNYTGLSLQQGRTVVPLTQDNLAAETNGKSATICYMITKPPTFGKILKENQEVTHFTQEDLRTGSLAYHMISLSSTEDSFEFTVFTSEANLTGQVLNVTVRPLIHVSQGLKIPNGITVRLNTSFFNASELAAVSDNDPVFDILCHPKYGKVLQTSSKRSRKFVPAASFTFQEVVQQKVALELNANMTGVEELNDSLVFVLKADNVQPAKGEFHFTVVPYDPVVFPTTKSPVLTTSPSPQTPIKISRNGTVSPVPSTVLHSTHQPSKNQQKFRGRNRWGNSNGTSFFSTTLGKPPRTEEFPFRNTPVRVESYPQKTSNPLLIILPLLALLLLIIIFVVVVVYFRHHRQTKQNTSSPRENPPTVSPSSESHNDLTQRRTTVPTVTVTPLSPSYPSSPVLSRFLPQNQASPYDTTHSNILVSSWSNGSLEPTSQIIHTVTPTLQKNQYWV